jgi:DNA end-binding protein Ku
VPRSIWNGTVTFGTVAIPIKLHSATQSRRIRFNEVHVTDGARIEHRRVCSLDEEPVPYDEIVMGYEIEPGEYVEIAKQDVETAAGAASKVIDIEHFVHAAEIDPVFYEKTYYLGARDGGEGAYRLVHDALVRTARVGIGRFVFHGREYLAALRPLERVLALHTMRFHDEVVGRDEVEIAPPTRAPTDREVELATRLVGSLEAEFEPERHEDTYRQAVLELIERKAAGERIEAPALPEEGPPEDLAAALEASLERHGGRRRPGTADGRRPGTGGGRRAGAGGRRQAPGGHGGRSRSRG